MGLTETETNQTNQHHLQLLRRFGPTEREMEDELRRSEEIKHELRSENVSPPFNLYKRQRYFSAR